MIRALTAAATSFAVGIIAGKLIVNAEEVHDGRLLVREIEAELAKVAQA